MTALICLNCGRPLPKSVARRRRQERYDEHIADCAACKSGFLCQSGTTLKEALDGR